MQINKIFKLTEQHYHLFINRGDDWQSYPPRMSWGGYVRAHILENGGTDFSQVFIRAGYRHIKAADKVTLYCSPLGYFALHYYSSLKIFAGTTFNQFDKSILFIDFGCGPATSGLAFIDSFKGVGDVCVDYIGIDTAVAMIERARQFLGVYRLNNCGFYQNFSALNHCLAKKSYGTTLLNFSFLLANKTFDDNPQNLSILMGVVENIIEQATNNVIFVYQNPLKNDNHDHWQTLRKKMQEYGFTSLLLDNRLFYLNQQQQKKSATYYDILTKNNDYATTIIT